MKGQKKRQQDGKSLYHIGMEGILGPHLDEQQVEAVSNLVIAAKRMREEGKAFGTEERCTLKEAIQGVAECNMTEAMFVALETFVVNKPKS